MTVLKVLALTAVLFVPGALAVSLVRRSRDGLKTGERAFLSFLLGTGLVALCAQVLAMASAYSLAHLLLTVGALCAPMALLSRRLPFRREDLDLKRMAAVILLLAAAFALFSPPGRIVFGYIDVGIYPNIAAHIEREGDVYLEVPTVREVDEERRDMVYQPNPEPELPFEAWENKAFYITDFEQGRVVPQFFYLWPSLMAVFASFLGPQSMFWAVTAVGVLALWGLYLLAARTLGWKWGVTAAVIAALSPLMVYFARYGTSEMMNMAFFVGGSLCLTAYLRQEGQERRGTAAAAALLFTLGFLCHADFIVIALPLALFYLCKRVWSGLAEADWWFCGLLAAGAVLSLVVGALSSPPYFHSIWSSTWQRWRWLLDFPGVLLPFLYGVAFLFAADIRDRVRRLARLRWLWVSLLWAGLAAFFVYVYFIRSAGESTLMTYGDINAFQGPSFNKESLVRWAWYFSFTGVMLIYAGFATWLSRARRYWAVPVALMGLMMTIVFSMNLHITPLHMYAMRRLVPVVLPTAAMAITCLLKGLADQVRGGVEWRPWVVWARKAAAAALLLYLIFFMVYVSMPLMGLQEGGNQLELCGEIAGQVGEGGVVVLDDNLGDLFGAPLRCFYGVESVWMLDNGYLAQDDFEEILGDLGFPQRPAYLLWRPAMSGAQPRLVGGLSTSRVEEYFLRENDLEKAFEYRPRRRTHHLEEIVLYRLVE
ncbi:MAG: glycosyltransferase family 39 protein [Actinomycetota bacterium]